MNRFMIVLTLAFFFVPMLGCETGNSAPDKDELSDYLAEHGDQSTPVEELGETDGF